MSPYEWFKGFLSLRELQAPSGAPLFSYKIRSQEYDDLKKVLGNNSVNSLLWDGCFVLYASEWWRRNYCGNHWRWEPILESLSTDLSVSIRNGLVTNGFYKWKREVFKDQKGHDYLLSVILECGIPNELLREGHYLQSLIKEAFQRTSRYSLSERDTISTIEEVALKFRLPESFQKESFYSLLAEIVEKLVAFKVKYKLSSVSNPVSFLDHQLPEWRQNFPIQIDGETAKSFFDTLLSDISSIKEPEKYILTLQHQLICKNDGFSISTELKFPNGFYSIENLRLSEQVYDSTSQRFYVSIISKEKNIRLGTAYKTERKGLRGFQVDIVNHKLGHDAYSKDWEILFQDTKSTQAINLELLNNEALPPKGPWVFRQEEDVWFLRSINSSRVPGDAARIVVDKTFNVRCEKLVEVGCINENLIVLEVYGRADLENEDEHYIVEPGIEIDEIYFRLSPTRSSRIIPFFSKDNKNIFIGFPDLYKIDKEKLIKNRVFQNIEIKKGGGGVWEKYNKSVFGNLKLRVIGQEGEVLFKQNICVIPEKFRIQIGISLDGKGYIRLFNSDLYLISLISGFVEGEIIKLNDGHLINLISTNGYHSDSIILNLFEKEQGNIQIKLPFPNTNASFFDKSGVEITDNKSLYIQDLHGLRLVSSNLDGVGKKLLVSLRLADKFENENLIIKKRIDINAFGQLEKPILDFKNDFEELFSFTENNDAKVEMKASYLGGTQIAAINIRQFSSKPYLEENTLCFHKDGIDSYLNNVRAYPLNSPFCKSKVVKLIPLNNNRWTFPENTDSNGKWIIYPDPGNKEIFRPVVMIFGNYVESEVVEFKAIHEAVDSSYDNRINGLAKLFEELSCDFSNQEWKSLSALFEETKHLPMTCFDVWKSLGRCKKALVFSFLYFEKEFLDKITREFSINWFLIPVQDWLEVFKMFKSYWDGNLKEYANTIVNKKLEELEGSLNLSSVSYILKECLFNEINPELSLGNNHPLVKGFIENSVNAELRTRHAQDKWPDFMHKEILKFFKALPQDIRHLTPMGLNSYNEAVVYLPIVLGTYSINPTLVNLPSLDIVQRFRTKEVIQFDEEYFHYIFNITQSYCWNKYRL